MCAVCHSIGHFACGLVGVHVFVCLPACTPHLHYHHNVRQTWIAVGLIMQARVVFDWNLSSAPQAGKGCLSVIGAKAVAGARVAVWPEHGRTHQRWSLNHNGTISSHLHHNLVLDCRGNHINHAPCMQSASLFVTVASSAVISQDPAVFFGGWTVLCLASCSSFLDRKSVV